MVLLCKNGWDEWAAVTTDGNKHPHKTRTGMGVGARYTNQSQVSKTFMHATQHLNSPYLKIKWVL